MTQAHITEANLVVLLPFQLQIFMIGGIREIDPQAHRLIWFMSTRRPLVIRQG